MIMRVMAMLSLMSMLSGYAYGSPPTLNPANKTTNPPPRPAVRPEDLLWSSAQECLQKGQYKEALSKYAEFARLYRNDALFVEALFYQGLCNMRLRQEVQALNLWDQVLKQEMQKKPKSRAWLLATEQLALWYGQKNKEDDRQKALKRALAEFPDDPITVRLHVQAAEERLKVPDYAGALGFYRTVGADKLTENDKKNLALAVTMTTKGAQNSRGLLEAANESLENNNPAQAIRLYETILKKESAGAMAAQARTKLGWCYYLGERLADAEKLWKEVIRQGTPRDEWVGASRWHLITLMAGPYHKLEEARALCLVQAKDFSGDFRGEQALYTRAWLYWTQKQWAEGKGAFEDFIRAYPEKAVEPAIQEYIRDCENGLLKNKRAGS